MSRLRSLPRQSLLWWPYVVVTLAIGIAFRHVLFGGGHIPYDAEFYHLPLLRTVQSALTGGDLSGWNQYSYGGTPLLANAQSAWAYPPHLILDFLLAAIGKPLTGGILDVLVVAHIWFAGVTTALLARRRGMGDAAAAFAGVFIVLSGQTVSQDQHVGMIEAIAWVPLALLLVDRLAEAVTIKRVIGLAACVALMILPGFLPVVPACLIVVGGTALLRARGHKGAVSGTIAGLVLGGLLAAAALIPVVELLGTDPPLLPHSSQLTTGLLTSIYPNAFGHWLGAIADFHGPAGLTNTYNYLGAGAVILFPLAITSGRRWVPDAALTLLLLFASYGAIGQDITGWVQGLSSTTKALYRPEDVSFVAAIPLSLWLAHGLTRPPAWWQVAAAAVFVGALALIGLGDGAGHHLHFFGSAPRRELLAVAAVGVLAVAAAVLAKRSERWAKLAVVGMALVAVIELTSTVSQRYFVVAPGPATTVSDAPSKEPMEVPLMLNGLTSDQRIAADNGFMPAVWQGFTPVWHLPDTNGFHPQFSKYQLARGLQLDPVFVGQNRTFPITPKLEPYFEEMNVKYVIVLSVHDPFAGDRHYKPVVIDPTYHVYQRLGSGARAYGITPSCPATIGSASLTKCATGAPVQVTVTGTDTRRLTTAASPTERLVVTGDPWYPGWKAQSRGQALKVERVGYLTAIRLPAGQTRVGLSYRPPGLIIGLLLSALALIGSIAALVFDRRRRRRSNDAPVRGDAPGLARDDAATAVA